MKNYFIYYYINEIYNNVYNNYLKKKFFKSYSLMCNNINIKQFRFNKINLFFIIN